MTITSEFSWISYRKSERNPEFGRRQPSLGQPDATTPEYENEPSKKAIWCGERLAKPVKANRRTNWHQTRMAYSKWQVPSKMEHTSLRNSLASSYQEHGTSLILRYITVSYEEKVRCTLSLTWISSLRRVLTNKVLMRPVSKSIKVIFFNSYVPFYMLFIPTDD